MCECGHNILYQTNILLISNMFNSEEPGKLKDDTDCEMVWAKVKIREAKDFYIGSYYKFQKS